MKKALLLFILQGLGFGLAAQFYSFETLNKTYKDISDATVEIPDTSPAFGEVSIKQVVNFKAFGHNFKLSSGIYVPIEEGYGYVYDSQFSVTFYAAKGLYRGRLGNGQTSVFSFKTEDSAGNKVFMMQWKNMGFTNGGENDFINYQVRLYEATGVIEYHFGPSSVTNGLYEDNANGPTIGLLKMNGDFTTIYEQSWLQGQPSSPVMVATNGIVNLAGTPPDGTLYRFTPKVSAGLIHTVSSNLRIYPTLVQDGRLNIEKPGTKSLAVEIFDATGKAVLGNSLFNAGSALDISSLSPGIYTVQVTDGAVTERAKVVVK